MKSVITKYNLKIGFFLAVVFPGIFSFAQPSSQPADILSSFMNFFVFILIIWILNYAIVDFTPVFRKQTAPYKKRLYLSILFTSAASVPIYLLVGFIFKQQEVTLAYVVNNNFSAKGWFFIILRIILFNAGILLTKYLYDNSLEQRKILLENEELKREHIHAVHESLKQQVDPHFLFNSLNTLQSLVKQNSSQSLLFISELSSVYRYMLLRRDKKYVTVREEIDFLKSYLFLLKIRFGDAIQVQIEVDDHCLESLIPPHTLQLLAENTVKHNKLSTRSPLRVNIRSDQSYLIVDNNISVKTNESVVSGVGLNNINSRYLLLFGKEIRIEKDSACFKIYLPLIDGNERIDYRRRITNSLGFKTDLT